MSISFFFAFPNRLLQHLDKAQQLDPLMIPILVVEGTRYPTYLGRRYASPHANSSFATPTAAPAADQPTSLSWPLVRPSPSLPAHHLILNRYPHSWDHGHTRPVGCRSYPPAHVATGKVHEPRGRRTRGNGRRRPITERLDAHKDVGGNKYHFYEPTYLPGGKVLMCAKGFHSATYCN